MINGNLIGPLVHLMCTAESAISNEAAWAISNATCGGTHDQIKYASCSLLFLCFCELNKQLPIYEHIICLIGIL